MVRLFAIAAFFASALTASIAGAVTPEEQAANCEEASKRFEELHGKPQAGEEPPVVLMYKHTFCPVRLTLKQGSSIRFLNVDRRTSHSFWFKDAGRAESDRFFPGEGTTMKVDLAPGEHSYLCGPHWQHEGMIGMLVVQP